MIVLGYTGKFFARWELTRHIVETKADRYVEYTECKYIRKVADDLETATAKFPELAVDPMLNGKKRSFNTYNKTVFTSTETFRFGKYNGKRIDEINEGWYIEWYMNLDNDLIPDESREYCKRCLLKYFDYTEENGHLISPKVRERENEKKRAQNNMLQKANEGKYVYLELKSWPNADGEITINNVTYTFPEVKASYYQGFTYYMPVLNGVAKRIKNKVIKAELMSAFGKIYIDNFTVVMK